MKKGKCGKTHWAQWNWQDTGPGRFHAIADVGLGLMSDPAMPAIIEFGVAVKLACGRVREAPSDAIHNPPRDLCCPDCLALDDIKGRGLSTPEDAPKDAVPV